MASNPNFDDEVIIKLLAKGISPAHVASLLDMPIDIVQQHAGTERSNRVTDAEEVSVAMQQLIWRGFEEAMKILDEGSPAMKIRLIGQIQGHALRFVRQEQPKEFLQMQEDFSKMLGEMSVDDTSISIYDQPDAIIHVEEDEPNEE